MNKIYDFEQIYAVKAAEKRLILRCVLYLLCFAAVIFIACITVENNLLLTVIFAVLLLLFILFSIVFWKIRFVTLKEYESFLDKLDTGRHEDYVGTFIGESNSCDESFCSYVFMSANKEESFLIHKLNRIELEKNKKYHIEYIGKYMYQWEIIE